MNPQKPQRFREHLLRRVRWEELDTVYLRQLICLAQEEDLEGAGLAALPSRPGDCTTRALATHKPARAHLVARTALTLCGQKLVPLILEVYGGARYHPLVAEGAEVAPGTPIGIVEGPDALLLQAERVLLNFLQHLSGIATHTRRHVAALGHAPTRLLDTRKTTPGFRMLEKYAVVCGGGWNHRLGLFDRLLVKDNHLAAQAATSGERLALTLRLLREKHPNLPLEVEVDTLEQLPPVLEAAPDVILLDNFSLPDLTEAAGLIGQRAWTEASGGITLESLPEIGRIGLDFVSCGAIIHQSRWTDIGMDWA